jgi:N-acetylneuraminic acid mutarotase
MERRRLDAGKLVVFGGGGGPTGILGDTWMWDGTTWTEAKVQGPPARWGAVMAELNGELVLFGGTTYMTGPNPGYVDVGDTWTWDGATWTERKVTGPRAREGAAMAALGGKLVLFGGVNDNYEVMLSDTWTWDGTSWSEYQGSGPSARYLSAMAGVAGKIVLFGGTSSQNGPPSTALGDTWTWDGTAWAQVNVRGPSARCGMGMVGWGTSS